MSDRDPLHGTNADGSAATDGGCSMDGRRGWAAGGAAAERQRGSGPATGSYRPLKPIRTEAEYDASLAEVDALMGAPADTPEGDRLDVLSVLIEAYEAERWPILAPDPVALIEHVMEARGYRQRDLAVLLGSQPRASEVVHRRRALTLPMIRALSVEWNVPADVLVREYELARSA